MILNTFADIRLRRCWAPGVAKLQELKTVVDDSDAGTAQTKVHDA